MEHLIPGEWFAGLPQWLLLALSAGAIAVLVKGADWLVDGASGLAFRLGVSQVIIGATVVSLGTTSPECAVSVMAAWSGRPGLALGNAIGSVVADTGLIFGLGCLLAVLPADRYILARQGWVQFGAAALLTLLCYGAYGAMGAKAVLGRPVGLLLLVLLAAYLYASVRWSRNHPGGPWVPGGGRDIAAGTARAPAVRLLALLLFGLALVVLASRALILAVTELAENHWHVPEVVIAATLVALGTSLPEMVIGLTSIVKGHRDLLVGNIIGADILNVLFVVGASAVAAPLPILEASSEVPRIVLLVHLPAMLAILGLFRVFIHRAARRGHFRRWQGLPLVAIYVAYVVVQYLVT
ncbi:MAG: sodium:calcium antiporter [Acidobacteriota bacterium]